jgi:hypothetical protein
MIFHFNSPTLIIDQMPMKTFILTAYRIKISFDDIDWLKVSGCVNHQSSPAKPWLIRNNSRWKIKIRTAVF